MWWLVLHQYPHANEIKLKVEHFIKKDQLGFFNGGWRMNDEACTHFIGMIDQMMMGHDFF